jgi:RNA polymerase sigma-70 factor, ECF subfamily
VASTSQDRVLRGVVGLQSDADLMAGICTADGEALEVLFVRYVRLVHRIAVDILRDRGEAEDVTQEVFLEIYRKAHLYDPGRGSVRVWLLQYAYHRTLRRKAALRRRAAYRGAPLDAAEALVEGGRNPLTPDECRWVIRSGLAQLPARQRATLELACFEELSLRDVADRLGVSVGCTRHYYYRGLARLQAWARVESARAGGAPSSELNPACREARCRGASSNDRADVATARAGRPQRRCETRSLSRRR